MDDVERLIRYGIVDYSSGPMPEGDVLVRVERRSFPQAHPRASHFEISTQDNTVRFLTPTQDHEILRLAMSDTDIAFYWATVTGGHIHINTQIPVADGSCW